MWYLVYCYIFALSLGVSIILTSLARAAAHRLDIMDHPAAHKAHELPTPLLGGVAIFFTFIGVLVFNLLLLALLPNKFPAAEWITANVFTFLTKGVRWQVVGLLAGGGLIFLLGLLDDIRPLNPYAKLAGQVGAALVTVLSGTRLELFLENAWLTGAVTVLWIVLITNSFNLLDNMDGLCAGIATICALIFFLSVVPLGQTFTAVVLLTFAGATAGFLYHNFSPASIFMGDAGSMFCGYVLSTLSVVSTFYTQDSPTKGAVIVPILVLGVPLFDTLSVICIRMKNRQSIVKGDKRHFSHRLVEGGMTDKQAVVFIYLVSLVVGLGATLLSRMGLVGAITVVVQGIGIFAIIILLMATNNKGGETT